VNAIRHLVANSVEGLQPDQVAVVDNHGHVLSEELRQDPSIGGATSQMRYRQQVEDYLSRKVETMLAQVIGPGNAVVRVSAEVESEATSVTEEKFDPDGAVVRNQTVTDEKSHAIESRNPGGPVGANANVPDKAAAVADANPHPSSTTEQDHNIKTTNYEINRTLTNVTRTPGTIQRVTAAVFIASRAAQGTAAVVARTEEELNNLRQIVINALGLKAAPGQSVDSLVTLKEIPFAIEPISQQAQAAAQPDSRLTVGLEIARRWAGIVGAGLVLLLFVRMLGRQKPEPVPVEVLTLPPDVAARALPAGMGVTPEMVNELIRQKPANVGTALRGWVAASKN
jgi:flagellar M-ring protein FliF